MNELKNDTNLREAVSRREQKLPPLPADLNERLMESLSSMPPQESGNQARFSSLSLWRGRRMKLLLAVAASIALFIIFHLGKEQAPQDLGSSELSGTPVVAQQITKQPSPQPVSAVSEPVEGSVPESVEGEPELAKAEAQSTQKSVKKQRKVVMQLVELIPTSEAKSDNVKELPASLIDPDPLVAMASQVEDIRQRGQRLQREIDKRIDN